MSTLSEVEEKRLAELREKEASKGYTPTEKAELAQLEEKAAGIVHVPVREEDEIPVPENGPEHPQDETMDPALVGEGTHVLSEDEMPNGHEHVLPVSDGTPLDPAPEQ